MVVSGDANGIAVALAAQIHITGSEPADRLNLNGLGGDDGIIATGLAAGRFAADLAMGQPLRLFPRETAIGSLCHYISAADPCDYQPANITFDLLPALDEIARQRLRRDKRGRHAEVCRRAIESMDTFLEAYARV